MEFRVLGALQVRASDGDVIDPGSWKQRALLAALLTRAGEVVPREVLYECVWPRRRPRHLHNALEVSAHRLRRRLGDPERITHRAGGYRVDVRDGELDWQRFEELVRRARAARSGGQLEVASELFAEALSLWRGRPFSEFDEVDLLRIESEAMSGRWLAAQEELAELDLALGRPADAVARMRHMIVQHPLRERSHELLMLGLIQSGCPGEALSHYHSLCDRLSAELGVDPSAPLRRLHHRVLVEDPSLGTAHRELASVIR